MQKLGTGTLEPLRNTQILITGVTGFVGTWLLSTIAYLNDVHGFGMTVTGIARRPPAPGSRAAYLASRDDVRLIASDVRQLGEIPAGTAWILHAAGTPDSRHHAIGPIDIASAIGEGTFRLLRLAEQSENLRGILHYSSGLVSLPADVVARMGATAVYVEAKRFSEALCNAFRMQSRLPLIITRPFTFIGPFQALDSPWAVNNFLHAAVSGQPIKLRGDGETRRTYLYGSDMAALSLHQLVRGRSGDVFDLGGLEEISLISLATLVASEAKRPLEIRINTARLKAAGSNLVPEMTKSVEELGFSPVFSPAESVARTLSWYTREIEESRL